MPNAKRKENQKPLSKTFITFEYAKRIPNKQRNLQLDPVYFSFILKKTNKTRCVS